ncbi:MAG: hypothetical protein V5A44_08445 [Haloarculaceae archaeon]
MTEHTESDDTTGERAPGTGDTDENAVATRPAESAADGERATGPAAAETGATERGPTDGTVAEESTGSPTAGERLAWLVQVGALVILCLVALVATFRFYFAASEAIRVWIADDFVSVFQAAFNLLVLVACAYGVSVLVRRLR